LFLFFFCVIQEGKGPSLFQFSPFLQFVAPSLLWGLSGSYRTRKGAAGLPSLPRLFPSFKLFRKEAPLVFLKDPGFGVAAHLFLLKPPSPLLLVPTSRQNCFRPKKSACGGEPYNFFPAFPFPYIFPSSPGVHGPPLFPHNQPPPIRTPPPPFQTVHTPFERFFPLLNFPTLPAKLQ